MLKSTAFAIAPSLTKLFNVSICNWLLSCWLEMCQDHSNFKSADPSLPKNYRPISILPIVSKLLERHVHSLIFKHLLQNHPISPFQWSFMPKRSTTSALCTLVHDWLNQLDNGNEICSVFFDVRKAFNSVRHSHLMNKLSTLQLCPYLHHWLSGWKISDSCCWWWAVFCCRCCFWNTPRLGVRATAFYHLYWRCCIQNIIIKHNLPVCWQCSPIPMYSLSSWLYSASIRYHYHHYDNRIRRASETVCRQMLLYVHIS